MTARKESRLTRGVIDPSEVLRSVADPGAGASRALLGDGEGQQRGRKRGEDRVRGLRADGGEEAGRSRAGGQAKVADDDRSEDSAQGGRPGHRRGERRRRRIVAPPARGLRGVQARHRDDKARRAHLEAREAARRQRGLGRGSPGRFGSASRVEASYQEKGPRPPGSSAQRP